MRRSFKKLCQRAGMGDDRTTYELRHSFVSLVSDQFDDLVKVADLADLAGHVDTRTTEGYRHSVRPSLPPCRRSVGSVVGRRWGRRNPLATEFRHLAHLGQATNSDPHTRQWTCFVACSGTLTGSFG